MVLADDLKTSDGRILLPRGIKLTQAVIERVMRLPREAIEAQASILSTAEPEK